MEGKNRLIFDRVKELFYYNESTGLLHSTTKRGKWEKDREIGSINNEGYLCTWIDGKNYLVHRLCWLYYYQEWPIGQVDHIDNIRTNNTIINLRDATNSENQQNIIKAYKNNISTGLLGVRYCKEYDSFQARVQLNKKRYSFGYFNTPEEAYNAYIIGKRSLHPFCTL